MAIHGLLVGFGAAFFLALSYIFSGMSVRRNGKLGALGLLCRAHIVMCLLSCIGLCFVYSPVVVSGFRCYWLELLASVGFYLVGQFGLFMAQRSVDSSRVVPMLGIKLVILAFVNMFLLPLLLGGAGESYNVFQWLGIAMTLASAFMLNNAGGRIPLSGLAWILLTCLGYALSDTCIKLLMDAMQVAFTKAGETPFANSTLLSLMCAFLSYILTGVISLVFMPFTKKMPSELDWRSVWGWISPFALCWLIAMLFLFTCFNLIGTVNGNIVQSTRGIIAIILGWVLSRMGCTELETKITASVFARRFMAGILMVLAIVLFNYKG